MRPTRRCWSISPIAASTCSAIEIWPHEFYYVAGLLIMAGIGLFLVTSAVGRAWCGYACPQTVWTDLFQHVERFIDGDRNAQIRLAEAPWAAGKIARRALKYVDLAARSPSRPAAPGSSTSPTRRRWRATSSPARRPASPMPPSAILTATTFILGGFLREQVCIYMCPWPRIQSAMLDEKSLIVTYKDWRGEPRGQGIKKATLADLERSATASTATQCVAVCPTGIDIREGPADRLHHLRAVHRCLRQGDGAGRPAARADRLYDLRECQAGSARASRRSRC